MAYIIYHPYVSEPHETAPSPAVQYAHSSVTYVTRNGVSDSEWIIPGSLENAERMKKKVKEIKDRYLGR